MEQTYVGIVVWVVLTVAGVIDDLDSPVVARGTAAIPADGVRTRGSARGEEQQGGAHEDREIARCLAHIRLRSAFPSRWA